MKLIFSINEGNFYKFDPWVREYVEDCKQKGMSARYIGSLVADFHRNLLKGGIFMYPGDRKNPAGKLRFLFEAAPLAFVVHHAGGAASDGVNRILEQTPKDIHEKSPLFIGSSKEVELAESMLKN